MALLLGTPAIAHAQQEDVEAAIKATFLYRFASFVQWPAASFPDPSDPVVICVSGDGEFAQVVDSATRGERIGSRQIEVRRLGPIGEHAGCHILYLGGAGDQSVAQALVVLRGQPILTVTDQRHGRARGMVHFVVVQERVRFQVDRTAAESSGLRLSSRLLQVALSVAGAGQP